jgi:hypothetical protein
MSEIEPLNEAERELLRTTTAAVSQEDLITLDFDEAQILVLAADKKSHFLANCSGPNRRADAAFFAAASGGRVSRLLADFEAVRAALAACVADEVVGAEPCAPDHHGNCQTHTLHNPCEVAQARALLTRLDKPGKAADHG